MKTSAQRVIAAANSWLHAETRRSQYAYDRDGRVCRVAGRSLEQVTEDHRVSVSSERSYLGRALGINPHVEIDYHAVPMERGDVFVLTTDGVHDHLRAEAITGEVAASPDDLDAARRIVEKAFAAGSPDSLTIQIVRIDALPFGGLDGLLDPASDLPPAPPLDAGMVFDGYEVIRKPGFLRPGGAAGGAGPAAVLESFAACPGAGAALPAGRPGVLNGAAKGRPAGA